MPPMHVGASWVGHSFVLIQVLVKVDAVHSALNQNLVKVMDKRT